MMNMLHVTPFLAAMHAREPGSLAMHLDESVELYSPFVTDPFQGREKVAGVLRVLLAAVDEFETTAIIADEFRAAIILRIRAGETEVTGVDDMSIDAGGLISSMSIQWRPLASIVAIQQKLAPLIGIPALELVERQEE